MSNTDFTKQWVNLAQEALGASVISASDDFFAEKEGLIKSEDPIFLPEEFTENGKWMDGWESRRKRHEGYDHCIIKLGTSGIVHGVNIDTSFFTGNYPPSASIDACYSESTPDDSTRWTTILGSQDLKGDFHNLFEINNDTAWNYIRLNIYPDGGVARLRVYGQVVPNWDGCNIEETIDLVALENGGRALMCNDEHFGTMHNIIKSTQPLNMGDGWETRRRREPGYDWAIFSLGRLGNIEKIVISTTFFKGNYPENCSIQGAYVKGGSTDTIATQSLFWGELLPKSKLLPDNTHTFEVSLEDIGAISHIRLNIFPDGGISRLKVFGKIAD